MSEADKSGYCKEEQKLLQESRKILGLPGLQISDTCVRVPVWRTHSIAITAQFDKPVSIDVAKEALMDAPGLKFFEKSFPTPLQMSEQLGCGVGRLRVDTALENSLSLWVLGDQFWKGAALNELQIFQHLNGVIPKKV